MEEPRVRLIEVSIVHTNAAPGTMDEFGAWAFEPVDPLPLEKCTGLDPGCPHYECPDGWHPGEAPNCSCTPDCALEDD